MRRSQSPQEWARSAELPQPVSWGKVESEVLARPAPQLEDESGADKVVRGIGNVATLVMGAVTFGSPVIALLLLLSEGDPKVVTFFLFTSAIIAPCLFLVWWDDRARGPVKLVLAGMTGVVSSLTYVLLTTDPDLASYAWAPHLAIAAAVGGLLAFVVVLVFSRPRRKNPQLLRWIMRPVKEARYQQARKEVLRILLERGVADLEEYPRMMMVEMPLGSWRSLDEAGRVRQT